MVDHTDTELASLKQSLDEAEKDNQRIPEATAIIEEFMRIIERARREGAYVYETAAYGRVTQRARAFLGRG